MFQFIGRGIMIKAEIEILRLGGVTINGTTPTSDVFHVNVLAIH
jgi:hypothetical protein